MHKRETLEEKLFYVKKDKWIRDLIVKTVAGCFLRRTRLSGNFGRKKLFLILICDIILTYKEKCKLSNFISWRK